MGLLKKYNITEIKAEWNVNKHKAWNKQAINHYFCADFTRGPIVQLLYIAVTHDTAYLVAR